MTADAAFDRPAIRIVSDEMRTRVSALAEASQEASVALLGVAAILACQPDGLAVDIERVAALLAPASAPPAAENLRFVEFVGSLAMWVKAVGPEPSCGPEEASP